MTTRRVRVDRAADRAAAQDSDATPPRISKKRPKALSPAAKIDLPMNGYVIDDQIFFLPTPKSQNDLTPLITTISAEDIDVHSLSPPSPFVSDDNYYDSALLARGKEWQKALFPQELSARFSPHLYVRLLNTPCPYLHLIQKDIHRTFPTLPLFQLEKIRSMLTNVLTAYSIYDYECGYSQGMAFVVGFLLIHIPNEVEVFWCFVQLMYGKNTALRCLYAGDDCGGLVSYMTVLQSIIVHPNFTLLNALARHLAAQSIDVTVFSTQWFVCVFSYRFSIEFAGGVWDRFIKDGLVALMKVAVAILENFADKLILLPMEALIPFLTQLNTPPMIVLQRSDEVIIPESCLSAIEDCKLIKKKVRALRIY